jgi:hypothetical protein
MKASSLETWDEFAGLEPADIRRRQLDGQDVAMLDVSEVRTLRHRVECAEEFDATPIAVPMQRIGRSTWALIGGVVIALVATITLTRSGVKHETEAAPPVAPRAGVVVPAPEPQVTVAVAKPKPAPATARSVRRR